MPPYLSTPVLYVRESNPFRWLWGSYANESEAVVCSKGGSPRPSPPFRARPHAIMGAFACCFGGSSSASRAYAADSATADSAKASAHVVAHANGNGVGHHLNGTDHDCDEFFDARESLASMASDDFDQDKGAGRRDAARSTAPPASVDAIGKPKGKRIEQKRLSLDLQLKQQMEKKTPQTEALEEFRILFGDKGLNDAALCRMLRARHWNVKKATVLAEKTLAYWDSMKPETIVWEDVAHEFETGKVYRTKILDKKGRRVLVFRPGKQNTKSHENQIKMLVYTLYTAIALNPSERSREVFTTAPILTPDKEKFVILLDFQGKSERAPAPLPILSPYTFCIWLTRSLLGHVQVTRCSTRPPSRRASRRFAFSKTTFASDSGRRSC